MEDNSRENGLLNFEVDKSWIEDQKIGTESISLQGYNSETGRWNKIPTSRVRESKNSISFSSNASNYNMFAITGIKRDLSSYSTTDYFPISMFVMSALLVVVEIRFLWNWLKRQDFGREILIRANLLTPEKDSRRTKFEDIITEFVSSGRDRALVRGAMTNDEILSHTKSAIEKTNSGDLVEVKEIDGEIHLIRE